MSSVHDKERLFHDQWAEDTSVEHVQVRESFEAPTALEVQHILRELGSLKGKQILDAGAGLGEASVYFALAGASVVALDLSPEMCSFQQRLAAFHGVKIVSHTGSAEELDLRERFDVVYAANLLHHLTDKEAFLITVRRLLKKDGVFVSWDPVRYNPIITVYRWLASAVRTQDERPFGRSDVRLLQQNFPDCSYRFFWISTLALFLKYFLIDRLSPAKVRYWKRIYEENPSSLGWWKHLAWMDDKVFCRTSGLRWLAWNIVFIGRNNGAE